MSCELTYEELHEGFHDALAENKELRNVLAKMSGFVNSRIPTLDDIQSHHDNCLEENKRLELSVETFRRYLQETRGFTDEQIAHIKETGMDPEGLYDSTTVSEKGYTTTWDKKKNLHDYMVSVLGYNQKQVMDIMESGAMLSNDPGVGYRFEHDFGKEHALDINVRLGREAFTNDDDLPFSEITGENVLFGGHCYTVIQRGDFSFYLNDESFTMNDFDEMIDELDPDTTAQLFDKSDYVFEMVFNEGEEVEGLEKYVLVKNPSMSYPSAFVPDNTDYPDNTQVEMDFDNPDEGMVSGEDEDTTTSTGEGHPHIYAHMGYAKK